MVLITLTKTRVCNLPYLQRSRIFHTVAAKWFSRKSILEGIRLNLTVYKSTVCSMPGLNRKISFSAMIHLIDIGPVTPPYSLDTSKLDAYL